MGIRVKSGRTFEASDRSGSPPVLVVSEAFVRKYYPDSEEPLGKMITLGYTSRYVGCQPEREDRRRDRRRGRRRQAGRTGGRGARHCLSRVRAGADQRHERRRALDRRPHASYSIAARSPRSRPSIPISRPSTRKRWRRRCRTRLRSRRFYTWLFGAFFAGIALLLALLGIYGVISYSVSQRTRELGIRMALGASRTQVMRLVLGQGFSLTVAGTAVGILAAAALTRVMASMLFGVSGPRRANIRCRLGGADCSGDSRGVRAGSACINGRSDDRHATGIAARDGCAAT